MPGSLVSRTEIPALEARRRTGEASVCVRVQQAAEGNGGRNLRARTIPSSAYLASRRYCLGGWSKSFAAFSSGSLESGTSVYGGVFEVMMLGRAWS
jgi:hypothetical protein